jgi:hypothetical protein
VLFALVALLGALLLFLVQPMIAKAILPWFGGAPAVWTTCLLFFQSLLLAGYAYAHLGRRLGPRRRGALHAALLVASLATLPVLPSAAWQPDGGELPVLRILGILAVATGAPYLLLAATAPLLQDWSRAPAADAPYRLYAWSNTGSLLALVAYPLVIEPRWSLGEQATGWAIAYGAFAIGCGWLALRSRAALASDDGPEAVDHSRAATGATPTDAAAAPTLADRALWFALSAVGCGLLLAITNQLTLDVAVVPLLFLAPLALYLVTFIVAFAGGYQPALWRVAYLVTVIASIALADEGLRVPLSWQVGVALATLVAGCMVCHGELARLAPPPRHATAYYLTIAAGGAVAGVLVAVVAPLVFVELWELPVFVLAPLALRLALFLRDPSWRPHPRVRRAGAALAVIGTAALAALFAAAMRGRPGVELAASRSFFGTLRVTDLRRGDPDATRVLEHGRIVHGVQLLDDARRRVATTYYAAGSGVELAIRRHPRRVAGQPLRVGVVGLGAGTIAAWATPGDTVRFYELDPEVAALARRHFTFLADSAATVDLVVGDGRLALARELRAPAAPRYDVLVVDAFLGDAIPVHLLTRECGALYQRALADDGVLAIHVSNRHLDLVPVVRALADDAGKTALRVDHLGRGLAYPSTWVLVTSNPAYLALRSKAQTTIDRPAAAPIRWTDRHSSLAPLIRWR